MWNVFVTSLSLKKKVERRKLKRKGGVKGKKRLRRFVDRREELVVK